jgi:hypothetical protein
VALNGRNITITVNGKKSESHVAVIIDGNATSTFSGLTAGSYEVVASYAGDNIYKANSTNASLTVDKLVPVVSAENVEFIVGNEGILNIFGPDDRDGSLIVNIEGTLYTVTLIGGEAVLDVSNLGIGVYGVDILYQENDKYYEKKFPDAATVTVNDKYPTPLKVDNLFIDVGEDANIEVYNIPKALNGKMITITVSGVESHSAIIDNGVASSTFSGLTNSFYEIVASYAGDNIYKANSTKAILTVIKFVPDVSATSISFITGNEGILKILGPDDCIGVLNVTIGNNKYTATLISGKTSLDVSDLDIGHYDVNILYRENEKYYERYFSGVATVDVLDKKATPLFVDDLSIVVDDDATIKVYGIPVALNGKVITIEIPGVGSHNVVIDKSEAVSVFRGLVAGKYDIIASYAGDNIYKANSTTAGLTVDKLVPVVSAEDVEFIVGNDGILNITGPSDRDGSLIVNISDVKYSITLNNGEASLDVSNLNVGTYDVDITYVEDDKYVKTNFDDIATITVDDKEDTPIIVNDLTINVGDVADINVTVPRSISGESITISINGKTQVVTVVDGNANAKFSGIAYGEYSIVVYYPGDSTHAENRSVATLTVEKVDPVTSINVSDIFVGNDETIIVNVPYDAEGIILFDIDGKNYFAKINKGKAVLVLSSLAKGNYTVKYTFDGDAKYLNATGSAKFEVSLNNTYDINTEVGIIYVGEDASVYVLLPKDASGAVTASVDEKIYSAYAVDGVGIITIPGLSAGKHVADVAYLGNDKYAYSSTKASITVYKIPDVSMNVEVDSVDVGEVASVYVELPEDANGTVTVSVGGKDYTVSLEDGEAIIDIPAFTVSGNYTGVVSYSGDDKYEPVTANVTIEVKDKFEVLAPDVVKFYHGPERFNVYVLLNGVGVGNKSVSITINGQKYMRTTNDDGLASIALNLNSGNYTVVVKVDNVTLSSLVTIKSTVVGHDVTKIFRNGTQYYATFYDVDGSVLANKVVKFNINGVFYYRETDVNGVARLNINLPCGNYIITAVNPVSGEMASNNVVVLTHFVEHDDMEKVYGTPTPYTVRVCGDDGRIVVGETVTFNINGVFYYRTTDGNGIARLNINLIPGVYIISSIYHDEIVSNKITIFEP